MKFVVNAGGKVHGVADEELPVLLGERGMRLATSEEEQVYFREQGLDAQGNPHGDALKAIEAAEARAKLGTGARQENPPTEPFATLSSDSPLARVREAKRQRILSAEATMTPTAPFEGHNATLAAQILRNEAIIAEAQKANEEALDAFDLDPSLPSATNQRAWLGNEEPKVTPGQAPTPAHAAATDQTIGDKIEPPSTETDSQKAEKASKAEAARAKKAEADKAAADKASAAQQPADPASNA